MRVVTVLLLAAFTALGSWQKENVASGIAGAIGLDNIDFDGDGDLDFLICGWDHGVSWVENLQGSYMVHQVDPDFTGAIFVTAGDLDGDGLVDAAGSSHSQGTVYWWKNTGSGFQALPVDTLFASPHSVIAAQLDGDPRMELIGASFGDDMVAVWNMNGEGDFERTVVDDGIDGIWTAIPWDIDGDGDEDIAGAARTAMTVCWWENTSSGWQRHDVDTGLAGAHTVTAADMDMDGDTDLIAAGRAADEIWLYTNDGSQNFTGEPILSGYDWPTFACAADIDLDGDVDVACAGYNEDEISWLENDGAMGFTRHSVETGYSGAIPLQLVDMDGDEAPDIISAAYDLGSFDLWYNRLQSGIGSADGDFSLFPEGNPAEGTLNIRLVCGQGITGDLELRDTSGRLIQGVRGYRAAEGLNQVSFGVLRPGVYFLRFISRNMERVARATVI